MNSKLVLLVIAILCVATGMAASAIKGPRVLSRAAITGDEILSQKVFSGHYPSTYNLGPGDSIGFTTYDYGTNGSPRRTLVNFGDGTIAMAQMVSTVLDAGTPDRGSWYSYSVDGGMSWPPLAKVEVGRRGWTSIDQFQAAGGVEAVLSHDFGAFNMEFNVDAAKGAGVWTSTATVGASVWPRLAIGDGFSVHIVSSAGGNPPTGIAYSRSPDAGTTFDIVDLPIFTSPGVAAGADAQDIAAQGSNVVIVSANSGGDVAILSSTDNGDTWDEQVIYDVAGLGELAEGQEEFQSDGSCSAVFDQSGNVHVLWSNFLAVGDISNNPVLFYSVDAPIMHWSESTGITTVAYPSPDTTIGLPLGRNGNYATQPDMGVDLGGSLFVVYASMVNDVDTAGNYFQHVFVALSSDEGLNWTNLYDVTPGSGFDASFSSVADVVDSNPPVMHVTYHCDPFPGNWVQMNHDQVQVAVMYLQVPGLIEDVGGSVSEVPTSFSLLQNYPNPFNPMTDIGYQLPAINGSHGQAGITDYGFVKLAVYDMLGREVATLVNAEKQPGSYTVTWDATGVASGVYFYRLTAGNFVAMRKLIVVK